MTDESDVVLQLRLLREGYAAQLPARLAQVEQAFRQVQSEEQLQALRFLVHGLAGSGASFGYPKVSESALGLEVILGAAFEDKRQLSATERAAAGELLNAMYRSSHRQIAQKLSSASPAAAPAHVARKHIYLVEDDVELAANIALQLDHFGYRVSIFCEAEQLEETVADPELAAILMDIVFPQGEMAGVDAVIKLRSARCLDAPVVFLSIRNDLASRIAAVRAGAAAYIMKPVDIGALVSVLDDLTSSRPPDPYRVLIVDDTEVLAAHYACTLQAAGMLTDVVADPMRMLAHLTEFKPDLVLMDMYLPGCTGAELATVIRQIENYNVVPIVFLSTENDTSKQLKALKLGGDDFLTKPIAPEHLVSAVSARLRRYRVLRSYIERDSLTGLLNHAATKNQLALETARAARQKHTFCFAMLDLDLFKSVNDTYGHLVGDRVLKSLAELLKRRVRQTDIVGRIGGEEFAIILLDTGIANAATLLDELRDAFSQVRHHADGRREFALTFSCGIAEYQVGDSTDGIHALADQALYRAKQAGRNRLEVADRTPRFISDSPYPAP